jgi:hypothetical protein
MQRFWKLSSSPKTLAHINQYMEKQNKHTNQLMESLHYTTSVQNRHSAIQKQRFNAALSHQTTIHTHTYVNCQRSIRKLLDLNFHTASSRNQLLRHYRITNEETNTVKLKKIPRFWHSHSPS